MARECHRSAFRFLDRIEAALDQLANSALIGTGCDMLGDDLPGDMRQAVVGKYVIVYRRIEDGIEVLRVLHGARDIPSILRDESIES
ncbi:type II toxin-antitoxin system RelE/ParE family toxin [Planctomycetes bacterium Pan216]|uniref:type II toxin-antitoxin system RelE/ParE family toxin n=1 Tax=Kolteria novifilia TaxID=2527975 RepID=UPI0011A4F894